MLLRELDMIDEIKFVHPKDMQDGKIEITGQDITTNLPYVEGVHLAFDHHASEMMRRGEKKPENHIIDPHAPSAARVVYKYFGGAEAFPRVSYDMMTAVDKGDSAMFTEEEVLRPTGWDLLNFLMDARTGLGRFRDFKISNYQLMMHLIEYCRDRTIEDILEVEDVKERVELYFEQEEKFKEQIRRCSTIYGNLVVLDLRNEEVIYAGNRFMIYAMYPETNISIHVIWGFQRQNTVFAIGKSIINRTSNTNVGELCLKYGGGGHRNAGTCQIETDKAEETLKEIVGKINADG
ncbi:putative exopolyphosphatase-like protein [Magnetofaba australis IT-1]|uniref:Putative exopolyphosphatase-like protein n=1 Tax=Magnetofaba australis IT-1 TaxID=1434232 RepID=A0A1Y2K783_9PROT|nr:putative exopolyphosphatase-like protein [Magnetofaba australis IT-1]